VSASYTHCPKRKKEKKKKEKKKEKEGRKEGWMDLMEHSESP
jgi:hypothetical protein